MKIWEGIVEDRDDPLQMGRVRVRIFGSHSNNKDDVPTELLPWATIILPSTNASNSGIGISPIGMVPGTRVIGFFIDGEEGQQPVIFGVLSQIHLSPEEETQDSFSDTVAKNAFIPEQEQFETLPVEVLYTTPIPGNSPIIINNTPESFFREEYKDRSSVSKIAIGDKENKHPHIERKQKPLEEGGIIDTGVPIATVETPPKEIIPQTSTNSNKANLVQYSESLRLSTNEPSTMETFSSAKKKRKDSNDKCVYTSEIKDYSDEQLINQILQNMQEFLNSIIKTKEQVWEENPDLRTYRDI